MPPDAMQNFRLRILVFNGRCFFSHSSVELHLDFPAFPSPFSLSASHTPVKIKLDIILGCFGHDFPGFLEKIAPNVFLDNWKYIFEVVGIR